MRLPDALVLQGTVYVLFALTALAVGMAAGRPDPAQEILFCSLLILLLGVPHGALDVRYARQAFGLSGFPAWLAFTLAYLTLTSAVVVVWYLFPFASLIVFLLVSATHFAGDALPLAGRYVRLLAGGSVVVLPALLHRTELSGYFALLTGPSEPVILLVDVFHGLALMWLPGSLVAIVFAAGQRHWSTAMEFAASVAILTLLPPLTAFCIYFCLMHGARHILRTLRREEPSAWPQLLGLSFMAMLGVVLLAAGAWWLMADAVQEQRTLRLVFIGLAALTLPHLLLAGPWVAGPASPSPSAQGPGNAS